ncbi:hypothetical protein MHH93_14190 [Priestia sp. FSL H7-0729]
MGYVTEFKSGQVIEVEDEFLVSKKGIQNLYVDMTADIALSMDPIEILVK